MFKLIGGSVSLLIGLCTIAMAGLHLGDATSTAWDSNAKTDIVNIRAVEATENAAGNGWVTSFVQPSPSGLVTKISAGAKVSVLTSASGYVIVEQAENGDLFVATDSSIESFGDLDHAITVSKLTGLPVDAATIAKTVDHLTIRSTPKPTPAPNFGTPAHIIAASIPSPLTELNKWLGSFISTTSK